ncbi:hypothetical protein [Actinopolymorpha alba]|uniref:hypothetical protein n=1 Tax=Actinopolymorpha alba TaxID=533267 RepID=UPI00037786CC|nr:hypothetical protein [Actinopolymorpha alba]
MIRAAVVNHNTSTWTELAVRSLFAQHPGLDITLTIYDNASGDDMTGLRQAADQLDVPIVQSGFSTDSTHNSHGEVLRQFVLDPANADCSYFLFLDTDVCFTRQDTVNQLIDALNADERAFGAGPRMSWDGETVTPAEREQWVKNRCLYEARLHPCCALIRNTPAFRRVVEEVGLSCATLMEGDESQYLDTCELMTRIMRTHGLHHVIVETLVLHAFGVSYPNAWQNLLAAKQERRDAWLNRFRSQDAGEVRSAETSRHFPE